MKYALIATTQLTIDTVVYPIGSIVNLIVYDGSSSYTPLTGTELKQVADTANLGDAVGV